MEIGPKKLVNNLNRKLSRSNRAVFRTKRRSESSPEGYTLLETKSGRVHYVSFEDLLRLARELGVLPPVHEQ